MTHEVALAHLQIFREETGTLLCCALLLDSRIANRAQSTGVQTDKNGKSLHTTLLHEWSNVLLLYLEPNCFETTLSSILAEEPPFPVTLWQGRMQMLNVLMQVPIKPPISRQSLTCTCKRTTISQIMYTA